MQIQDLTYYFGQTTTSIFHQAEPLYNDLVSSYTNFQTSYGSLSESYPFSFREVSNGAVTVHYKRVESDAPAIRFLGCWFDLGTGYIYSSPYRSNVYYPFFDVYTFFKNSGFAISPQAIAVALEKHKLEEITLREMMVELVGNAPTYDRSRSILANMLDIVSRDIDNVDPEQVTADFIGMLFDPVKMMNPHKHRLQQCIDATDDDLYLFLRSLSSVKLDRIISRHGPYRGQLRHFVKSDLEDIEKHLQPHNIGTDVLPNMLSKSATMALNLVDMVLSSQYPRVVKPWLFQAIKTGEPTAAVALKLIDASGAREVLSGRSINSVKVGLTRKETIPHLLKALGTTDKAQNRDEHLVGKIAAILEQVS